MDARHKGVVKKDSGCLLSGWDVKSPEDGFLFFLVSYSFVHVTDFSKYFKECFLLSCC